MNDATHLVTIDPAGIPALVEAQALRAASDHEGLPLIALYPDHSAVWVRPGKGKAIASERGWIAFESGHCFHSTRSLADAQAKLARKLDAIRREAAKARENRKAQRRAGLIARLCKGAVATIADARALGYCSPGISAFQSRHGIGDSATLPELLKTGDPSAVRLAFAVARKVSR